MYHIVKAKFATRNPSAGEQSLLESFACLLDIANTDNYEHVWKVINDCDLDFNEAAERLLSQPAPFPSPPAVRTMTEGSAAISTGTISTPPTTIRSACPDLDRSSSLSAPAGILSPDVLAPKKQRCEFSSTASSSSSAMVAAGPSIFGLGSAAVPIGPVSGSSSTFKSSSSVNASIFSSASNVTGGHSIAHPQVLQQANIFFRNLSHKIQSDGVSNLQDLACLEFNLFCDVVSGKPTDSGIVSELNKLGAFANLQQLALSGQLWSFVPIYRFQFSGAELLPKFLNAGNTASHRGVVPAVSYHIKLNSFGLSLKLEYTPIARDEASMVTEILLPFSCFADPLNRSNTSDTVTTLTCSINRHNDIRTDSVFSSMFLWKGKPNSSPPISFVSVRFFDIREADAFQRDANSLRNCQSPHALDFPKLSQPVMRASSYSTVLSKMSFNFFSDPWYFARVIFDEKLVAEVKANESCGIIPDILGPDIKFVLRFKYPAFLMPALMRAKERMKLSSWCRDKHAIGFIFERLLKRESIARVFPFLNSGMNSEVQMTHNFFEIPSLYITSLGEEEMTVVYYHSVYSSHMPSPLLYYLKSFLKDRASGKDLNTFDNHLASEGQRIMSRKARIVSEGAAPANPAHSSQNTANSTSEWMNYLALTDADVAPQSLVPSFFLQTLLPSQQQSLNFMVEIEKRPCSNHLFVQFEVDDQLAATEFPGKYQRPIQHARYYSLCPTNETRFVSSPPQVTGGLLCDPMGSGKTRICIAMIAATLAVSRNLTASGSKEACNLILVPPNVLGHWIRELESCFGIQNLEKQGFHIGPNISIALAHSSKKHDLFTTTYDIVLTTYQTFNSRANTWRGNRAPGSIPLKYHRVFCDEAHIFRNKGGSGMYHATYDSIWLVTGPCHITFPHELVF